MKASLRGADANRDRWMVSYMDVLTILLIFFVAAAAQSAMPHPAPAPEKPPEPPKPSIRAAPGPKEKLAALGLDVKEEPRGLVISLPQTILFSSGDDSIGAEAHHKVEQIAEVLRDIPNRISLEGHADAVPIHNRRFKNNWELAAARSLRLVEVLGHDCGIDDARLSIVSYSSFDPRDSNDTPDGRASNRRVEIVVLTELGH